MRVIHYACESYDNTSITPCPYFPNKAVSGPNCYHCEYFKSHDKETKMVYCKFDEAVRASEEKEIDSAVYSPSHYNQGGIECIDGILAARGSEATKEFCICNAMKYLWRLGHKDDALQEAKKAKWYIDKYIELCQP